MTSYSFSILDRDAMKRKDINRLINHFYGDFIATETKDGAVYFVDFSSDNNAQEFAKEANKVIEGLI